MNELKKLIQASLNDKVTAEDCRKALEQMDQMAQAKTDLTNDLRDLENRKSRLSAEVDKLPEKLGEATKKAEGIVEAAEHKAEKLLSAAKAEANVAVDRASEKLAALNATIKTKEAEAFEATEAADKANTRLKAINAELKASEDRMKKLLG